MTKEKGKCFCFYIRVYLLYDIAKGRRKKFLFVVGPLRGGGGKPPEPLRKK